jgi:hypothetical protein
VHLALMKNKFATGGLNALFGTLNATPGVTKTIYIQGNPGTAACNKTIATGYGWTVDTTTE